MKEITVRIDGMMSIFDDAGVEKQIERRGGVVKVDADFLSGTATIVYDETGVSPDDIAASVADCGYHCRGEVVPAHLCEPVDRRRSGGTAAGGAGLHLLGSDPAAARRRAADHPDESGALVGLQPAARASPRRPGWLRAWSRSVRGSS